MSSSAIQRLVAVGAQDVHLTGDPEISFFNSSYKRHTNFSQGPEKLRMTGKPKAGTFSTIPVEKYGDLVGYMYIAPSDPVSLQAYASGDWTTLVDYVELYIGGRLIDRQTSLFTEACAIDFLANNISKSFYGCHQGLSGTSYFFPFRFFFCENVQSALPLCAMQYHDVEVRVYWGRDAEFYDWECYANYYHLGEEERQSLRSRPLDMLITQVQENQASGDWVQELNFNHPVKCFINSDTRLYGDINVNYNKMKMSVNGEDMCDWKYCVPHFVHIPAYYHSNNTQIPDVMMYAFGISVTQLQPTGCLNFSRVSSFKLHSELYPITYPTYAISYNILRVQNGQAALMYAN
jgi:hypothetical protein